MDIQNTMRMRKIIAIIDSCITIEQFESVKNLIEHIEFETIADCRQIKEILIKKEKQFQNG